MTGDGESTRAAPGDAALTGADHRLRGYAEIGASSLILGTSATLTQISTMPASLFLVLRMGLAGIALAALFFLTGGVDEVRRSGRIRRMVVLGFVVALEMIFYFASIRTSNVTVGVSLEYMAPVWVAVLAPWALRTRRRPRPRPRRRLRPAGRPHVRHGDHARRQHERCRRAWLHLRASLLRRVRHPVPPLAVWQTVASGYLLTWPDVWIVIISGLVYTALCFSLLTDGLRYVRVEHAGILVIVFARGESESLLEPLT